MLYADICYMQMLYADMLYIEIV